MMHGLLVFASIIFVIYFMPLFLEAQIAVAVSGRASRLFSLVPSIGAAMVIFPEVFATFTGLDKIGSEEATINNFYSGLGWVFLGGERDRLLRLFPGEFLAIEHFGSTAVPGLSAKPIIDILAGVDSMSCADALMEPLCRAKYTTSMEFNASLVDRRWLMRWAEGHRTHHLHLMVFGSPEWDRRLAFRDVLRANTELAQRYEKNKRLWAAEFRSDREAYTAAKADFIREVLRRLWLVRN